MSTARHGGFKFMFRHKSVSETVTNGTFSAIISFNNLKEIIITPYLLQLSLSTAEI